MTDAKGVWLRPRRLRTKIEQSTPESLTRLSSRFVLIHMWWGEELKPLDSVQLGANPRRGRNSVTNGRQTSVRKPIPSCQAQTHLPMLPSPACGGWDGADVKRQAHSAGRRGGGRRARACCCDELRGLEDPLAQRSLKRDPIWHHDPGSRDRREPDFHILLGHEIFDGRTFGHITG